MGNSRAVAVTLVTVLALAGAARASQVSGSITSATCPGSGCVVAVVETAQASPATCVVAVDGTFVGTLEFDELVSGSPTWQSFSLQNMASLALATNTTADGLFRGSCAGLQKVRVVATAYTSGTAKVTIALTTAPASLQVSLSGTTPDVNVLQVGGNNTAVGNGTTNTGTQRVTISSDSTGVVSATQGTAAATANGWPVKVTDGTSLSVIKAASTAAQAGDPSFVVALSPNSPIPTGTNTIGSAKITDGTHTATVSAGGAVLTDASATVQPISAASLPLPTGAAQDATVSTMSGKLPAALDGSGFLKTHEQGTAAISAASLPLPTGASTEATLAKVPLAQGSTTSGQSGALVQGAVTTSAPTYTTAQTSPLSLTTAGALRVDGSAVTQPASLASLPALAAGTAAIGHLDSTSTDGTVNSLSVASTVGGTTVLASSPGRRALLVCNVGTVDLFCSANSVAPTSTAYGFGLKPDTVGGSTPAFNGGCQSISGWSGALICLAASGTGQASIQSF